MNKVFAKLIFFDRLTYSVLNVLSKSDFKQVLSDFPEAAVKIQQVAIQRNVGSEKKQTCVGSSL